MTGQQLKNSILQMAVQGKLVPQDPNDEPASVLLARIRKEKEELIKAGKIKKEKNPSCIFYDRIYNTILIICLMRKLERMSQCALRMKYRLTFLRVGSGYDWEKSFNTIQAKL